MNRIRTLIAAAAVAVVGATTIAAPAAQAQVAPLIEYRTEGGFVAYHFDMKIYRTGFVVATMSSFHQSETLFLYDYISAAQVRSLRRALARAHFAALPGVVRTQHMIPDIADRVVTYRGKTVRFTTMGAAGAPVATPAFIAALTKIGNVFTRIQEEPLVDFSKRGGFHGVIDQSLTITRSGHAKFWNGYPVAHPDPTKEKVLDFAEVNALKRLILAASWFSLPDAYTSPIVQPDEIHYEIGVANPHDKVKTVSWTSTAHPPQEVEDVHQKIEDIIQNM